MDAHEIDVQRREIYRRNAPPVDSAASSAGLRQEESAKTNRKKRVPSLSWVAASPAREPTGTGRGAPTRVRRRTLRVVVYAFLAVVLVAAIAVGSLAAVEHLNGRTAQSAGEPPSAAMFRGNAARTGVYPDGGPTDQPALLWKFQTGDHEGTSPVVSDGIVYVGGGFVGDEDDYRGYLYALDARSGEERWRFPWSANYSLMWNPSCPAVSEGVVYIRGDDSSFYALDAESGQELWRFETGDSKVTSPAASDGVVYVGTSSGHLYALDAESGQELWRFWTGDSKVSSPAVSDGVVYVGTHSRYLYALDAQTGQERWTAKPDGPSRTTGDEPWSDPAVSGGVVYFGESGAPGHLRALDAQTGEEKWMYVAGGMIRSSPAVSDGVVYLLCDAGHDRCLAVGLDASTGEELWQFVAANGSGWAVRPWSSPSVSGSVVYFGTDESGSCLHALDALTGEELWTWLTSGNYSSSPTISDGVVYFSARDGSLYALGSDQPIVGTADVTSSPSVTSETPDVSSGPPVTSGIAQTGAHADEGPTDRPDVLWTFKIGSGEDPVVSDGVVYVGGDHVETGARLGYRCLYALDAQSGELKWEFPAYRSLTSSPAISDGVVYCSARDGYLYALDARNGQEVWKYRTGYDIWSSPAVAEGMVYFSAFGADGAYLYALDAASGEPKWDSPAMEGDAKRPAAFSPTVSDGVAYFSRLQRFTFSGSLRALDAQTGQEKWTVEYALDPSGSPVVSNGVVYFGGPNHDYGSLHALDAQTGQEKWTYEACWSSPVVSNGVVYLLTPVTSDESGSGAIAVALDATTGKELWQFVTANISEWALEEIWSSPRISGDVVYFGTADDSGSYLYALDASTGEELWTWVISGESGNAGSSPAISDGVIYFSGTDGSLYALK